MSVRLHVSKEVRKASLAGVPGTAAGGGGGGAGGPGGVSGGGGGSGGPPGAPGAPGAPGSPGAPGAPGVGVPTGGSLGEVLTKFSGADYDTGWLWPSGDGGGMANPMTTVGDLVTASAVIAGTPPVGVPDRIGAGAAGTVLTSNGAATEPTWHVAGVNILRIFALGG